MVLNRKNLAKLIGLDHFYVGFPGHEIRDLKRLTAFPFCVFNSVKSGKDSWSGVYWTTTHQSYFEMVESQTPGDFQMGVALSANQIQYVDLRGLQSLFPGLKKSTRRLNGKRWFDYFYWEETSPFYVWAMHYHFLDRQRKFPPPSEPSVIERFTELNVIAPLNLIKTIEESCGWAPMRVRRRRSSVQIIIKNKDRSDFTIKCRLSEKAETVQFVSLKAELSPFQRPLPTLKYFTLKRSGRTLILSRRSGS